MKKSTLFLLAGALALTIITILVTSKGSEPPPKKLSIDGYATKAQLDADRARGIMEAPVEIASPIDEIVIERDAAAAKRGGAPEGMETIRLVRDGEGKDAAWRMTTPIEAPAVKYQVERIVEAFKAPSVSKYGRAVKETDLARYDLEPARRIHVTLKSKGAVWNGADLVVGRAEKGEAGPQGEPAQADTWVMKADDMTTAYLMGGKDFRTPVEADLGSLRDKKLFAFDADDVTKIEITPPDGGKITLAGTRSETPPGPDAGADAKPTVKVDWKLTEPAGVTGDASVASYARSLAGVRANDFVPLPKADATATAALSGKVWTIRAEVKPKGKDPVQTVVLKVSDAAGETVWAQVDGKQELASLASYTAKSLRKGLDELKNKVVYELAPEDVVKLTLKGDAGPISLAKTDKTWAFTAPVATFQADPTVALKPLSKLTAVRWARADEVAAARAALATPDIEASLETKDGVARAVRFSKVLDGAEGEKNRWGVVGDPATAEPFQVQDYNAKRYETTVDALRWKKLLVADKDAIQRVEITAPGATAPVVLERMPSDSGGGDLAVVTPPTGKQTKEEAARTLGSTLAALDAKSFHEGKAVGEAGLDAGATKLVVKLADGSTATLLIATKSAGEGEVFAVVDAGPLANTVVGINEYQAKNLTKTQADLLEDIPAAPAPAPGSPTPVPPPTMNGQPVPPPPAPAPTPAPAPAPAPAPNPK